MLQHVDEIEETAALLASLRDVWDVDELVLAAAMHDLAHSPTFAESAAATRHDDAAKDPEARVATIEDVLTVAKRVLQQRESP